MDATGAMLALMKLQAPSTGLGQRLELPSTQFLEAALRLEAGVMRVHGIIKKN
jgi:hypothetical protein